MKFANSFDWPEHKFLWYDYYGAWGADRSGWSIPRRVTATCGFVKRPAYLHRRIRTSFTRALPRFFRWRNKTVD